MAWILEMVHTPEPVFESAFCCPPEVTLQIRSTAGLKTRGRRDPGGRVCEASWQQLPLGSGISSFLSSIGSWCHITKSLTRRLEQLPG